MTGHHIPDFSVPLPLEGSVPAGDRNLRQWLHRIDEACCRSANPLLVAVRNAALAALRGEAAPPLGLTPEKD